MMRHVHLAVNLPFVTPEDQEASETFLMALLGFNSMINRRYLRMHPETVGLYSSGTKYAPPDQSNAASRISEEGMRRVAKVLRDEGAQPHRIASVLHLLNGVEEFLDIPALYARGEGDCNELVPVRVAELWRAGILATPYLVKTPSVRPDGGLTYHAIVVWPDGSAEDPSLILGMGGEARAVDRLEEIRKNKERLGNYFKAAQHLVATEGADPDVLGEQIEMMGLLPKDGAFRA